MYIYFPSLIHSWFLHCVALELRLGWWDLFKAFLEAIWVFLVLSATEWVTSWYRNWWIRRVFIVLSWTRRPVRKRIIQRLLWHRRTLRKRTRTDRRFKWRLHRWLPLISVSSKGIMFCWWGSLSGWLKRWFVNYEFRCLLLLGCHVIAHCESAVALWRGRWVVICVVVVLVSVVVVIAIVLVLLIYVDNLLLLLVLVVLGWDDSSERIVYWFMTGHF